MKQTVKNTSQIIFHAALFGSVIFTVALLTRQPTAPPSPAQPPHATQSQPDGNDALKIQQGHAVQLTQADTSKQSPAVAPSPKYNEITKLVQHEYTYRMFTAPNDPQYTASWSLTKVNAPQAWDLSTGNGQTVVAVIDSGVALAHEDLTSQWYINSGETGTTQSGGRCWTGTTEAKQSNNCDDDNNGYVDDWRGWNFVLHDNTPQTGRENPAGDGVQHGTEVSGIVGARGNNSLGSTALNWNTKIMPLQALSDEGVGYTSGITAAIYYAVDNGAQVINLSLGTYANDPAMQTAVRYATAHGVVIVAAAGNCGTADQDGCADVPAGTIAYPAAYADVIAVGASTSTDQRAGFSSYGQTLDVVAPGYGVPASPSWSSANQTSLYSGSLYGTSFAAPQVASLVALIKSLRPSSSVADITALIDATATKPSAMNGLVYTPQLGHGIINAYAALTIAAALNTAAPSVALLQAGTTVSEHTIAGSTTLSSGCTTSGANAPCTIQATQSGTGYTRYLPYTMTTAGATGWSWSTDIIEVGEWQLRARSGDSVSSIPYYLIRKG